MNLLVWTKVCFRTEQKQEVVMDIIKFQGANLEENAGERVYTPRGDFWANVEALTGFYDHTLLFANNKVRIMEDSNTIAEKLSNCKDIKLHYRD